MSQTRRRHFLTAAGALLASPFSIAQSPRLVQIGFLSVGSRATSTLRDPLPAALAQLGWIEGYNLNIRWRYADGYPDRLPELASELVRLGVQLIVAPNPPDAGAARRATQSIPIVMVHALDPVADGFAQSLARPGGNITGVLYYDPAFVAKTMQLVKETLPDLKRIGLLYPGVSGMNPGIDAAEAAAQQLGVISHRFPVSSMDDIGPALAAAKEKRIEALRVSITGATLVGLDQILAFVASNKIPSFFAVAIGVERGGFMSYAPIYSENVTRAASFVDRILKGANPADLPFEYPTRYELVINLKTAKQLGVAVPPSILLRADREIE